MSLSSLAKTEISLPRLRRGGERPDAQPPARRPARHGRSSREVVGLDISAGEVVAARAHATGNRGLVVERAVAGQIDHAIVRDGEVADPAALGQWLRTFFAEHRLPKVVRVGLASPRAVMRVIDLPPIADAADVGAAVRMQAAEHIAMPLEQVVLDHQLVGDVETADGPRTRATVVAAQRESVERLLDALRSAGLRPQGIDLSGFALARALHDRTRADDAPVLYVHVGGVSTMVIVRARTCELTRLAAVDLEQMSRRLAERDGVSTFDARARLLGYNAQDGDARALEVLDTGLGELADDISKTIEYHDAQHEGERVAEVVVSGPAALIPGFPDVLAERLGEPVRLGEPPVAEGTWLELAPARVAVAAGLAVEEVPA